MNFLKWSVLNGRDDSDDWVNLNDWDQVRESWRRTQSWRSGRLRQRTIWTMGTKWTIATCDHWDDSDKNNVQSCRDDRPHRQHSVNRRTSWESFHSLRIQIKSITSIQFFRRSWPSWSSEGMTCWSNPLSKFSFQLTSWLVNVQFSTAWTLGVVPF